MGALHIHEGSSIDKANCRGKVCQTVCIDHGFNLWKRLLTLNLLSTVQQSKLQFYYLSHTSLQVL